MTKPTKKKTTAQPRTRNTVTHSISFDWQIFDVMEAHRTARGRLPLDRTKEVTKALEFYYAYKGVLPTSRLGLDSDDMEALGQLTAIRKKSEAARR